MREHKTTRARWLLLVLLAAGQIEGWAADAAAPVVSQSEAATDERPPLRPGSLEAAISAVWPDATEWTVEGTSVFQANLDEAVLVSLAPHQTEDRIDRYWTVLCGHRVDPAGWDCGMAPPYIRLRIRAPDDARTCLKPVPGVENRSELPDDALLEVVDYVRHDPTLRRDLEAACENTWRPRDEPFEKWRCAVDGVSVAEGLIYVSRPAGRGCGSGMTLERSCQDGECLLKPVRCSMVCA